MRINLPAAIAIKSHADFPADCTLLESHEHDDIRITFFSVCLHGRSISEFSR